MRICLVDDESSQLNYLKSLIESWSSKNNIEVLLSIYQSSEEMLFETGKNIPFDLIILDIQMKKINGIELAKRIRKMDDKVLIVFLSGMADYVYEGYEVMAFRYLLKPLNEDKLFEVLDQVSSNINKEIDYLIINTSDEMMKIAYDDIYYFQSLGHYVEVHLENKEYDFKASINDICDQLKDSGFVRTHRSYIVNLKFIDSINKSNCIMSNNKEIPISRNSYKTVNSEFIKYYRRKGNI